MIWTKMPLRRGSNAELHVLTVNNEAKGFVEKPHEINGDRSAWRCFIGVGFEAQFLGHRWTLEAAKAVVQSLL